MCIFELVEGGGFNRGGIRFGPGEVVAIGGFPFAGEADGLVAGEEDGGRDVEAGATFNVANADGEGVVAAELYCVGGNVKAVRFAEGLTPRAVSGTKKPSRQPAQSSVNCWRAGCRGR